MSAVDYARFALVVGAVARWLLSVLAGMLVANGYLTDGGVEQFVITGVLVVTPLAWSLYQKLTRDTPNQDGDL